MPKRARGRRAPKKAKSAASPKPTSEAPAPVKPGARVQDALLSDFLVRLVSDRPSRRDLTSLNVEHGPKERFERIGGIYSARVGRTLTQWEVFAILVAEAEERYEQELAAMRGRRG